MKASRRRQRIQRYANEQRRAVQRRPLLTRKQSNDLLKRAAKGDKAAVQTLVLHNLRYVFWFADRHLGLIRTEDEFDEMVQEGCLGLAEAVAAHDRRSVTFLTYAHYHVKKNIYAFLRQRNQVIHLPSDVHQALRRQRRGEPPVPRDSCHYVSGCRLEDGLSAFRLQLRGPRDPDKLPARDYTAADTFDAAVRGERIDRLRAGLKHLTPRLATILKLRYGLDGSTVLTLEAIGEVIGVTRTRVYQLEGTAIRKLEYRLHWMRGGSGFFTD
jgi:RNA polymerase primary sigma factor